MTDPRSTEPINRVGLYGCIHPVDQGSVLAHPPPPTRTDPRSINPVQPLASIGNLRENQLALLVVVYVTTVNRPGIRRGADAKHLTTRA